MSQINNTNEANKLRQVRDALRMKQREFAEKLGITQSYLSAVELGKKEITTKLSKRLIELFGVTPEWLMSGAGSMFRTKDLHPISDRPYTQSAKKDDLDAEKGQNKSYKIRGNTNRTTPSLVNKLKNDPQLQAYRRRAEQWTEKQAEYKELLKSDLRHNAPAALQLITESDHLLWLAGNLSSFHLHYFKAFTSSRFGFDALNNPNLDPEKITYKDYKEDVMKEVEKMEKYRAAITKANSKIREALHELLPFDESEVIQRFLLEQSK